MIEGGPFGGSGTEAAGQPPEHRGLIYQRIDTRMLNALRGQNSAMKQCIISAIPAIEKLAAKLPQDDALYYFKLTGIMKKLLSEMTPKHNPNATG